MDRAALARMIDHTKLDADSTPGQIALFCGEAAQLDVGAICIPPNRLPLGPHALPDGISVVTVIGFPTGAHRSQAKAAEATQAVADGADELDMVIDLGLAASGMWDEVGADIARVRAAAPDAVLKVIIESGWLGRPQKIVTACQVAEAAGADFVKTSTGFHEAGGATFPAVELMAATVDGRIGVKAAGGIQDTATALAFIDAGATRLGCSATKAILGGL